LAAWLIPPAAEEGLAAQVSQQEQGSLFHLGVSDELGSPLNNLKANAHVIRPDLKTEDIELKQVGAGQYEAAAQFDEPGTYLVTLSAKDDLRPIGQITTGLVVPYSPEYRAGTLNLDLLERLAALTRPQPAVAGTSGALNQPGDAFTHNLPAAPGSRELWQALLLLAALFFPLDVALRRLQLSPRDVVLARAWLAERLRLRSAVGGQAAGGPRRLETLFRARERVRERSAAQKPAPADKSQEKSPVRPVSSASPAPAAPAPPPPADAQDALARLREAKKRAGQGKPRV